MPKRRNRRKKAKPQQQTTARKIKLHPRAIEAIERQLAAFRRKFGRDPGPNDPIFFDADADTPVPLSAEKIEAQALEAMREAGTEYAYAYKKTGLLSLGGDMSMWPKDRREEWEAAVAEYRLMEEAAKRASDKH